MSNASMGGMGIRAHGSRVHIRLVASADASRYHVL